MYPVWESVRLKAIVPPLLASIVDVQANNARLDGSRRSATWFRRRGLEGVFPSEKHFPIALDREMGLDQVYPVQEPVDLKTSGPPLLACIIDVQANARLDGSRRSATRFCLKGLEGVSPSEKDCQIGCDSEMRLEQVYPLYGPMNLRA